jgi:hypothetical protein
MDFGRDGRNQAFANTGEPRTAIAISCEVLRVAFLRALSGDDAVIVPYVDERRRKASSCYS